MFSRTGESFFAEGGWSSRFRLGLDELMVGSARGMLRMARVWIGVRGLCSSQGTENAAYGLRVQTLQT